MGFPWSAWLASLDGKIWPLLLTVGFQAVYYFYGMYRLLNGKQPLPDMENPDAEQISGDLA